MAAWDFRESGRARVGTLHVQTFGGAQLTPTFVDNASPIGHCGSDTNGRPTFVSTMVEA